MYLKKCLKAILYIRNFFLDNTGIILYYNTVDNFKILEAKIDMLTKKLFALKSENERLKAQIGFFKEEEKRHRKSLSENYLLNQKQKKAIIKLEKILKKIDGCGSLNG